VPRKREALISNWSRLLLCASYSIIIMNHRLKRALVDPIMPGWENYSHSICKSKLIVRRAQDFIPVSPVQAITLATYFRIASESNCSLWSEGVIHTENGQWLCIAGNKLPAHCIFAKDRPDGRWFDSCHAKCGPGTTHSLTHPCWQQLHSKCGDAFEVAWGPIYKRP